MLAKLSITARELPKGYTEHPDTERAPAMYFLPKMLVRLVKTGEVFVVQRITGNNCLEIFDGVKKAVVRPSELRRANSV